MTGYYLVGIDVGTYESKGVITTVAGAVVASARVAHTLSLPRPGWAEHDAGQVWWHDFVTLCRRLLAESGVTPGQIAGVGVSAIAPCVLPVDREGRPLRPGILYGIDTRASAEVSELEQELGREAIFAHCALHLSSQAAGPKILWLRRHEPEVWAKTETILTGSGYLVFKLTGEKVIDRYTATAYAPLFDVHARTWSAEMARPITPLDRLPRLAWSTEVVGRVTAAAASETGLAASTPVVAGTADAAAEALSAGLARPGDLMVMYGSSIFFIQKTATLVATDKLWAAVFLEEGTYAVAGGMSTGGSLTRWFRDHLAPQEVAAEAAGGPNAYAALADLAATAPLGSKGLIILPYFAGERTPINDPEARGLIAGLTLSHTRADLYRALLESVGYGIRHNVDTMREMHVPPQRILAVGGGTRNPLWLQIVSDIAGVEQLVPDQHYGASYGDAFLAGVGIGLFADTTQVTQWVRHREVVRPRPDAHAQYEAYYRIYRQLYEDSAQAVHQLARLAAGRPGD
jgi:xylulokinase